MNTTRRALFGAASAAMLPRRSRASDRPVIKIGIINDQSGVYRDVNGPTSVACTKQAIQEFAPEAFDVEVLAQARTRDLRMIELPIQWSDSPDSSFRPLVDGVKSFRELREVRRSLVSTADPAGWR